MRCSPSFAKGLLTLTVLFHGNAIGIRAQDAPPREAPPSPSEPPSTRGPEERPRRVERARDERARVERERSDPSNRPREAGDHFDDSNRRFDRPEPGSDPFGPNRAGGPIGPPGGRGGPGVPGGPGYNPNDLGRYGGGRERDLDDLRRSDPEMFELESSDRELERRGWELSQQFRRSNGNEKDALRKQISETVNQHFDVRQKRRELMLARMEKELARMREELKKRSELREQIMNRRMNELTGERNELDF